LIGFIDCVVSKPGNLKIHCQKTPIALCLGLTGALCGSVLPALPAPAIAALADHCSQDMQKTTAYTARTVTLLFQTVYSQTDG
jgi:hypothetical protein